MQEYLYTYRIYMYFILKENNCFVLMLGRSVGTRQNIAEIQNKQTLAFIMPPLCAFIEHNLDNTTGSTVC